MIFMGVPAAVAVALLLVGAIPVAVVSWRKRRDRFSTPAARYMREVRGINMDTYRRVKAPGYARQVGDPQGYVGGTGPPGC
jgi:hypothetical protein